ncbi:hypothetical protein [Xanthomonas arboricola]|uniref:hypothetical protein n=1 Tax=Xanthomonas arboricola TaxID=56448 RepID=UPI0012902B82|nr:hypothetical protein [Xanthomonas arboricola]
MLIDLHQLIARSVPQNFCARCGPHLQRTSHSHPPRWRCKALFDTALEGERIGLNTLDPRRQPLHIKPLMFARQWRHEQP